MLSPKNDEHDKQSRGTLPGSILICFSQKDRGLRTCIGFFFLFARSVICSLCNEWGTPSPKLPKLSGIPLLRRVKTSPLRAEIARVVELVRGSPESSSFHIFGLTESTLATTCLGAATSCQRSKPSDSRTQPNLLLYVRSLQYIKLGMKLEF